MEHLRRPSSLTGRQELIERRPWAPPRTNAMELEVAGKNKGVERRERKRCQKDNQFGTFRLSNALFPLFVFYVAHIIGFSQLYVQNYLQNS